MKTRLISAITLAAAFATSFAGAASAQSANDAQQRPVAASAQPSASAFQRDANASEQSTTDMSYGGVPETKGDAGAPAAKPCTHGPQCDIFFGS